jgi:hypothetical protein
MGLGLLAVLTHESNSWAQDESTPEVSAVNQAALSNEDIAQNEERLKRLEEELLKTLDVSSKPSAQESPRNPSLTAVKISDVKAPRRSDTAQIPSGSASNISSSTSSTAAEAVHSENLRELEQHPALQPGNRKPTGRAKQPAN